MRFEDALIDVYRNFLNKDKARVFGEEYEEEHTLDILKELGQDEFMRRYEADKEVIVNQMDMYALDCTLDLLKKMDEYAYEQLKRVKDNIVEVENRLGMKRFVYRKDR